MMQLFVAGCRHFVGNWRTCCQGLFVHEDRLVKHKLWFSLNRFIVVLFDSCPLFTSSRVDLFLQCVDPRLQEQSNSSETGLGISVARERPLSVDHCRFLWVRR